MWVGSLLSTIYEEFSHVADTHGLCFHRVDAQTHPLGNVIVGGQ